MLYFTTLRAMKVIRTTLTVSDTMFDRMELHRFKNGVSHSSRIRTALASVGYEKPLTPAEKRELAKLRKERGK